MLAVILRNTRRSLCARKTDGCFFSQLNSTLQFTNRCQVFIQLSLVGPTKLALELAGILEHKIQNALLIPFTCRSVLARLAGISIAEEPLKSQPRIDFRRHGCGGSLPGNIKG